MSTKKNAKSKKSFKSIVPEPKAKVDIRHFQSYDFVKIHSIGPYQIVEVEDDLMGRVFFPYVNGQSNNTYYASFQEALLGLVACEDNTDPFMVRAAAKLLNVPNVD